MPFEISKYSKGLPSLLGLKERGRGIPFLADQVSGTMDMRDLYLLDQREAQALTNIVGVVTGLNTFVDQIPPGEMWYIWAFSIAATIGAGAAITAAPLVFFDGLPIPCTIGDYVPAVATESFHARSAYPFWAGPGTKFGMIARSQTANPTIGGLVVFSRLKV